MWLSEQDSKHNENVSYHLFILDNDYSKDKDFILVFLDEIFEETRMQQEYTFYNDGPQN